MKKNMVNYDNVPIYKTSRNDYHWKIVQKKDGLFELLGRKTNGRRFEPLRTYSRYRDARKYLREHNPDLIVSYVPGVNFYCSSQLEPAETHMTFGAKR